MDDRCLIGLPQWQHAAWHADNPNGLKALQRYSRHFNSVEGNNSFYGTPSRDSLARWLEHTPEQFRFCFKIPRVISHAPLGTQSHLAVLDFLHSLEIAHHRLGIVWLQLSSATGPEHLSALRTLFRKLPDGFQYALEVRHSAFFDKGDAERELHQLLARHQMNRVMFDTRCLFASAATDPDTREAQRKKPHVPLHVVATGQHPMVRFISSLDISEAEQGLQQWAFKVSQWINEGRQPYLFFHTPNNDHAPQLAYRFTELLQQQISGYQLPSPWPEVPSQNALF